MAPTPGRKRSRSPKPNGNAMNQADWENLQSERKQLPVFQHRQEILRKCRKQMSTCNFGRVVVMVGETGSGKTTQIPQFFLERDDERIKKGKSVNKGLIAVTQPRRVAAVSVANRVALERNKSGEVGREVGYTIRFDDCTTKQTRLKYMTDGMLMREAMDDELLSRYKVIVLDEAHERTINTDILFGVVKRALMKRQNLIVVVMSATLNVNMFTKFFTLTDCQGETTAPDTLFIKGRQHPVGIYYSKLAQTDYVDACVVATLQVHLEENPGDILVFLTGQEEIEACAEMLSEKAKRLHTLKEEKNCNLKLLVCPLFAALPSQKQMKVFEPAPPGCRKVIIATNIAETSITVSGVRYVIDTGLVKMRNYRAKLGLETLQVVPVSKAQAVQRSGRAGREAPGKCFRLFQEVEFEQLIPEPVPEIKRVNLAEVVLQLFAMGVKDVFGFDFLESPSKSGLRSAHLHLLSLGAICKETRQLTPLGRRMAAMPLEPVYAKLILAAKKYDCEESILSLTAMLSVESPFYVPRFKRDEVNSLHSSFRAYSGDHLTLISVYKAFAKSGFSKEWCAQHFIKYNTMTKAHKVRNQLEALLTEANRAMEADESAQKRKTPVKISDIDPTFKKVRQTESGTQKGGMEQSDEVEEAENESILRCLASCFFLQTAQRCRVDGVARHKAKGRSNPAKFGKGPGRAGADKNDAPYNITANGMGVYLHPSSSLFSRNPRPKWVIYDEVVHSSKTYLRGVTEMPKEYFVEEAPEFFSTQRKVQASMNNQASIESKKKDIRRKRQAMMVDSR